MQQTTPSLNMSRTRARLCIVFLVLSGFSLGVSEFVVIGIEPDIAEYFNIPLARAGELISFFSVAYALCTPVLALTTGRFHRFTLLIAYSIIFCAANLFAIIAPSFEMLLFSRVLLGAVSGALLAVGITYIPELVGIEKTPWTISIVYAAFSVAMVLTTPLTKIVADLLTWELAFWGALILAIASCLALICVLPHGGSTDVPATLRGQLPMLRDPRIICGALVFMFGVGAVYVLYGYITPYLEDVLFLDTAGTSTVLMCYGCACFISNLLSGWCSQRFGMKGLIPVFLCQAAALAGLAVVGSATVPAIAIIIVIALTMYVVSTPCITMFMFVARTEYPEAATLAASLEPMSFNIGIAFGTAVGGMVVSNIGIASAGFVGGALSLVACTLVIITIRLDQKARSRIKH